MSNCRNGKAAFLFFLEKETATWNAYGRTVPQKGEGGSEVLARRTGGRQVDAWVKYAAQGAVPNWEQ